ncbi:mitochondrial glycerol-3-phosphate dehydrogenase [Mucor circinelloides]
MHDWSGTVRGSSSLVIWNNKNPSNNNKNKCFFFFHLIAHKDNVGSTFLTSKDLAGRKSIVYAEQAAIEKPTWHAPTQKQELNKLNSNKEFDLLIVGGGATGTGVALEAASRELNVALVERDDFTSDMFDVLARRTRLTFLNTEAALSAPPKVIELMFEELGWDKQRQEQVCLCHAIFDYYGLIQSKDFNKRIGNKLILYKN